MSVTQVLLRKYKTLCTLKKNVMDEKYKISMIIRNFEIYLNTHI